MKQENKANSEIELAFENNHLAMQLFGEFDQNLAAIEKQFDIKTNISGNHVFLKGSQQKIEQAQLVLEALYSRLEGGEEISIIDVNALSSMAKQNGKEIKELQNNSANPLGKKSHIKMATIKTKKTLIHARSAMQDAYIRALKKNELIFAIGPAGTGKTYLGVAYAVNMLEKNQISRIILSRPAVEAGEQLGFLPGDMKEKVDPYLRPLYDALFDMMEPEKVERYISNNIIEIAPLAFMRGRTLANSVIILDEAQNTTSVQMKMFLTRLGENSKMIIAGDPSQIDLMKGQKSGLIEAIELLGNIENVSVKKFGTKDIIRHHLVSQIVNAYQNKDKTK